MHGVLRSRIAQLQGGKQHTLGRLLHCDFGQEGFIEYDKSSSHGVIAAVVKLCDDLKGTLHVLCIGRVDTF